MAPLTREVLGNTLGHLIAEFLLRWQQTEPELGDVFVGEAVPALGTRSGGQLGAPRSLVLQVAGRAYAIAEENANRVRFIVQNHGPGDVYLTPDSKGVDVTIRDGLRVVVDATLIDELPSPHVGRWYAIPSATDTRITVIEVGPGT